MGSTAASKITIIHGISGHFYRRFSSWWAGFSGFLLTSVEDSRTGGVACSVTELAVHAQEIDMKKILIAALVSAMAAAAVPGAAFAKHGADDPAGHTRHGNDGAGHR